MTSPSDEPLATAASDLVQALATRLPPDLLLPTLFTLLLSFTAQAEVVATLEVIVSVARGLQGTVRRAVQVVDERLGDMEGIDMPVIALVMAMKEGGEEEVKQAIEGAHRVQAVMARHAADELKVGQPQKPALLNSSLFKDIARPESSHTEVAMHDHNIQSAVGEAEVVVSQSCSHFDTLYLHK
jgi:hypothetical protein